MAEKKRTKSHSEEQPKENISDPDKKEEETTENSSPPSENSTSDEKPSGSNESTKDLPEERLDKWWVWAAGGLALACFFGLLHLLSCGNGGV